MRLTGSSLLGGIHNIFLIDLDGTLYSGKKPLPYTSQFIDFLNKNQYQYLVLTNCPSKTQKQVSRKLKKMNIHINPDHILTSGMATAQILKTHYAIKSAFVLGTRALKKELKKQGINCSSSSYEAVVIGYSPHVTYKKLCQATVYVNQGAKLFGTNIDNTIPFQDYKIPHTGAIAKSVEFATNQDCIYIGKPEIAMLEIACDLLKCDKNRCVMIGDRLDADILFATKGGIRSYLVTDTPPIPLSYDSLEVNPTCTFKNLLQIIEYEKLINKKDFLIG